jgi:CRISPR/Cas system-associated exonuclease Cas4 (RecB family)
VASTRALIHAPWSASKISTALRCPRLFHYRYVEKVKEVEVMPEARIGKAVHAALEQALLGTALLDANAAAKAKLLDEHEQARFDMLAVGIPPFVERIEAFRRRRRVTRQLVEYALAVREDFTSTQFYAGDAFYRGIIDAAYIYDDESIAVLDHKTGMRHGSMAIIEQLEGYAVLSASHFKNARRLWLGVHWVAERALEWSESLATDEINRRVMPRLLDNVEAAALAVDDGPRPNPSTWCERCAYRSICPAGNAVRFEPVEDEELDDV